MLTVEKKEGKTTPLCCLLDCGSTVNCLDLKTYKTLKEDENSLKKRKSRLRLYTRTIVTQTCTFAKIVENIVKTRLLDYLLENSLISEYQYVFFTKLYDPGSSV